MLVTENFEFNKYYGATGSECDNFKEVINKEEIDNIISNSTIVNGTIYRVDRSGTAYVKFQNSLLGECQREEINITGRISYEQLSKMVGNSCDFLVTSYNKDTNTLVLSRRKLLNKVIEYYKTDIKPGSILSGKIISIKKQGLFFDVGRGLLGVVNNNLMSLHKLDKYLFKEGDTIPVVYRGIADNNVVILSMMELLGDWKENAKNFNNLDVCIGKVKKVMPYGAFIILSPNLTGLADNAKGFDLKFGDTVSVLYKNSVPEKMYVKLNIIRKLDNNSADKTVKLYPESGRIVKWRYEPEEYIGTSEIHEIDFNSSDGIMPDQSLYTNKSKDKEETPDTTDTQDS